MLVDMNGTNEFLDEWFIKLVDFRQLPYEYDFPTDYKSIANQLNKWVHPYVNSGAMLNDNGYLTDHGPDHIKMLIKRISSFISIDSSDPEYLNPFEILILLLAAHVHDVGNIFGRTDHHLNAQVIIEHLGAGVANQNRIIWEYVYQIASAHKGSVIQNLYREDSFLSCPFRPQLLAAILKFADELSEDASRADRYSVCRGLVEDKKPEAEIYHQYALCLTSLDPDLKSRVIKYSFQLDEDLALKTFPKRINDATVENVYLLDEIYLRTLKAHYERLYCMRFMRPSINFDLIKVSIRIKLKNGKTVDKAFDLIEMGLEDANFENFFGICPELIEYSGEKVKSKIENGTLI